MIEQKSMEEVNAQKKELTTKFRQTVLNNFVKKMIPYTNRTPESLKELNKRALDMEAGIYNKATSMNDYLTTFKSKLEACLVRLNNMPTSENQTTSQMIQKPVIHANQSAQPVLSASSSLNSAPSTPSPMSGSQMMSTPSAVPKTQQRNTTMQSHQSQEGSVSDRQNVHQRYTAPQHPSVRHSRPMNEDRSIIGGYQDKPGVISSMLRPSEQGTRAVNTSVQKSHMPSSPVYPQTAPARLLPARTSPAQTLPARTSFAGTSPAQLLPARTLPAQTLPARTSFAGTSPAQLLPARTLPAQTSPAGTSPAQTFSAGTSPAQTFSAGTSPAQTSSASFLNAKTDNAAEWKLLWMQHLRAKMTYLPQLLRLHQIAKGNYAKAQGLNQFEAAQKIKAYEQMIKFLHLSANDIDLTRDTRESFCKYLARIASLFNSRKNQAPTVSKEHISSVNHLQNTPSVSEKVFPQSQFNAPISAIYSLNNATKQIDNQTVLYNGPRSTAEQNSPHNLKRNSEPMQPSDMDQPPKKKQVRKPQKVPKEKDIMDSMFIPCTKPTRDRPKSTTLPKFQKNTSSVSDPKAVSQNKTSIATPASTPASTLASTQASTLASTQASIRASTPASTPVTTCSVPKEVREPVQSVTPKETGTIEPGPETEVQNISAALVTSGTLATSLPSDGPAEGNQPPQSAMLPIERLVHAVQSSSKENRMSAVKDMRSAINEMDKLPDYAIYDQYCYYSSMDYNTNEEHMMHFSTEEEHMLHFSTEEEHMLHFSTDEEHMMHTQLKCDSDASSRDNHDGPEVSDHDLVVAEVRDINQRLIETQVEITSTSDSESSEGTVVRCTYMTLSESLKKQLEIVSPLTTLSIEFIIPSDYPESPPKILDSGLHDSYNLEDEAMLEKAKCEFNHRVQGLSMSIGEMAKAWDQCARQTVNDVAINFGVKTFKSIYGNWRQV